MAVATKGLQAHEFDVQTYERIVASGALDGLRVELLDGIITEMSPQSPEHADAVEWLTRHFAQVQRRLRVQLPLQVTADNSLPEPDLAVTAEPRRRAEHPRSALLVIEVAASSHLIDRGRKAALYAETGIAVYWVVDVPGRKIEVFTDPADGGYRTITAYAADTVAPAPLPDTDPVSVADLFAGRG